MRVPHKEAVYKNTDEDLDHDLNTEGGHGQYPGPEGEVLPQRKDENCWSHHQETTDSQGLKVTNIMIMKSASQIEIERKIHRLRCH